MRDPHRHAGHVARASDPQHLPGIEIGLHQHEAGQYRKQQLLGDPKQRTDRGGHEPDQDIHPQMLVALCHHNGAEECHPDHDEDLHFVGAEQRDAEQVAADHVGEVEHDRHDEKQCQHELDGPCDPIEDLNNHPSPHFAALAPRRRRFRMR